jgi:hypothetical protein
MITVDINNVPDEFWGTQDDYEEGDRHLAGYVEALELEPVLKLEDDFGWDFMYKLPDGRYAMADRNSGTAAWFTEAEFNQLKECA